MLDSPPGRSTPVEPAGGPPGRSLSLRAPASGRRRLPEWGADQGLTLVEMLVTALLLAVVLVPLGRVFSTGVAAASASGARQDAAELANTVLAKLEATPYGGLGFGPASLQAALTADPSYATASTSDTGTTYSWQGSDLVQLPTGLSDPSFTLGADSVAFAPVMNGVRQGMGTFAVVTHIAYGTGYVPACPGAEPAVTALAQAYVHVYVSLSWHDSGGNTIEADTIVYPGGLGHYDGPSYQPSLDPAPPTAVTASPAAVTGEVKVSFTAPSSWFPGDCFAVGWADANQQAGSSGLLSSAQLGTITPGETVDYVVSGLAQAAEYVFYVTAYSADGVESSESSDTAPVQSPTGPLVRAVTTSPGGAPAPDAYGPPTGGTSVTITGSGFSTAPGATLVYFGSTPAASVSCSSTTTCSAKAPAGTATVDVTAETPTGPGFSEVSSPTLVGDQFTYEPTVLALSPTSGTRNGGTSVTITGVNFVVGNTTFTFGVSGDTVTASCTSTTSCTAGSPAETAAEESAGLPVDVIANTPGGSSSVDATDQFTYK